ncbi:MAG: hypothetical protein HP491_19050 [Nitrospira sp.]|nr:hypothetical protein [Nitrospira sp.]MBH0181654.1 hypothetical protein [Nitrospira sp.]MBH0184249.1 hypothetical protein [Nitrospira sp.]
MLPATRLHWTARLNAIILALSLLAAATVHAASMGDSGSETEAILLAMIPIGKQLLEKQGKFVPYGGAMTMDGKVVTVAGYSGPEPPPAQEIIDALNVAFRTGALEGTYKATGLFSDVEVSPPGGKEKTRAIVAVLDHQDNYSVTIYFPYKIIGGTVHLFEVFALPGENKVFQK